MLTIEQKNEIKKALELYVIENNISYGEVSKGTRANASYFTQICKGHYFTPNQNGETVIPDAVFRKIASYVGYELERINWHRVITSETLIIEQKLIEAKDNSALKAIIGSTGCGKTYTIDHFVAKNKHSDIFRITVGCLHKVSDVIDDLLDVMRLEVTQKSLVKKLRAIEKNITDIYLSGGSPLIIIDEAENLKLPVFGLVKQLYDGLIKNAKRDKMCGIVLIGTPQLMNKIEKLSRKDKEGMPQFTRRIKAGCEVMDERAWYGDRKFMDYITSLTGDRGIIELLKGMAENYGEVNDYLEPAMQNAEKYGNEFTLSFFKQEYRIGI